MNANLRRHDEGSWQEHNRPLHVTVYGNGEIKDSLMMTL